MAGAKTRYPCFAPSLFHVSAIRRVSGLKMCRMTDTGTRWKRTMELPSFGETATYWAVLYNGETRYTRVPESYWAEEIRRFTKPMYAVRVTARSI